MLNTKTIGMETTEQTNNSIGDNIDQEALVNSFFEGVTGPIDSGMREMVEEFCQDIIWRTSAIPPRKQALFADEIGKLLKEVPELMTLSELQTKLIAILDKIDAQVADVREKVPDELYTKPVVQKKGSATKPKPKHTKIETPEPKDSQEDGEQVDTLPTIIEEPVDKEKVTESVNTELNKPVQDDFWEIVSEEMSNEDEISDADDKLLSMFESDNAAFIKNGEVQSVNEPVSPPPTVPTENMQPTKTIVQPQQTKSQKKRETSPTKTRANPLQSNAFANVHKIRDKITGTPNPRQSGAVIKIGWAIAKGTITWEPVDKCTTYDELMEFASKIK